MRFVRRLRAGDQQAIRELHQRHGPAVYGYLRRLIGDEADDVYQQVMLEAWLGAERFDPARGSALTWLLAIARFRAIDALRQRVPQPFDPSDFPPVAVEAQDDVLLERWRLSDHLQRIDPRDRELLQLRFYDQLTQTEIAARTGIPLGTVKSRMIRGLERLRELSEEEPQS